MLFGISPLFSGDAGIYQTVAKIKTAIYYALREPNQLVRRRAEQLIREGGVKERDERGEIVALAKFVRDHFHYVHDPRGLEYTKSPEVIDKEISAYNEFIGDCDDASGYLAALLRAIGYRVRLAIIANPQNPKQNFTHIFNQVFLSRENKWVTLDMTAKGKPLGWTAPNSRMQTYDV